MIGTKIRHALALLLSLVLLFVCFFDFDDKIVVVSLIVVSSRNELT